MAKEQSKWKRIAKGEKLPCDSLLMKKDGTIISVVTGGGVKVGQDAYYLPIEELKSFPKEESEDEKIRRDIVSFINGTRFTEPNTEERLKWLSWLEKQGEQKAIKHNNDATIDSNLNDYCCKVYSALHKENGGNLSFARLQHLAMDIYKWCKEQQKSAEWSEEDEEMFKTIANSLDRGLVERVWHTTIKEVIAWLKSLKDRVQPKQEWDGGDEAHLHSLITHLEQWIERHPNTTGADIQGENITWLKSLRPQMQWKPSEEQLSALHDAALDKPMSSYAKRILMKLYKQLKNQQK